MDNRILVTGATGTVGNKVVKKLAKKNANVVAGLRDLAKAESSEWYNVEVIPVEHTDHESVEVALKNVDKLFLISPPHESIETTKLLIDQAIQTGVSDIIRLSSMNADENFQEHSVIDDYLLKSKINCTILRPNFFMQNFNTYELENIKRKSLLKFPAGDSKISFIDVRDIAEVAVSLLLESHCQNQCYTLTGRQALSYDDVAKILSTTIGKNIQYKASNDDEIRRSLFLKGWSEPGVNNYIGLYQSTRAGKYSKVTGDVNSLLNRAPISFAQYASDHAELWY